MAVTQYIGARYVPKFYEGSSGSEWDANVVYDPLTIVTWIGSSWTSKKNVPASVGAPNLNPEYWVNTGNFNQQVDALQTQISALQVFQAETSETLDQHLTYCTPEQFGAAGDGVTDDYGAVQQCLEYSEANGLVAFFTGKTYAVSQQISMERDALASGSYFGIQMNNGTIIKYIGSETTDSVFYFKHFGDKLRITGGTIDCSNAARNAIFCDTCNGVFIGDMNLIRTYSEDEMSGTIYLKDCKHCWIDNVKIVNRFTNATGILTSNTPDTHVYNCEISYVNVGIDSSYGILLVCNSHIWAGGVDNPNTDTIGIRMTDSTPRLFMDEVYIDGFITGIDCGTIVSNFYGAGNLFYWPTSVQFNPGQHVTGIKAGLGSGFYLKGTRFQAANILTLDPINYSGQIAYYAGELRDLNDLFTPSENIDTVTRGDCRIYDHVLNFDFQIKVGALDTDHYGVIPLFSTSAKPPVISATRRVDVVAWNYTQEKGIPCRCGIYTTDNILIIHCAAQNVAIGDIIVGSMQIQLR